MKGFLDDLLFMMLDPRYITQVVTITGLVGVGIRKVWSNLLSKEHKEIDHINSNVKEMQYKLDEHTHESKLQYLRLSIMYGVNNDILSKKEVLDLYDEYKNLGGNSFISRIVEERLDGKD